MLGKFTNPFALTRLKTSRATCVLTEAARQENHCHPSEAAVLPASPIAEEGRKGTTGRARPPQRALPALAQPLIRVA